MTESNSQVDMQTLVLSYSARVRSDVENVVATVEIRVHDAILSAIDNLVIAKMELAMRSVKNFWTGHREHCAWSRPERFLRIYRRP